MSRRAAAALGGLLAAASVATATPVGAQPAEPLPLTCDGPIAQGGLALCRTLPGAILEIGGEAAARADADGWATLAFARDAASAYAVRARQGEHVSPELRLAVEDRDFIESEVGGLDCDYVAPPRDPEIQARIARAVEQKNAAWRFFSDGPGARQGFIAPGDGIETSPYGSRRRRYGDDCENYSVHWGLDLRAPTGSPIVAPAGGTVTLADDLYFEGGAVFLDHGHGLISVFMHMSQIDVEEGDTVAPGEPLGLAGMTGTANGPHIHWGLKWRNVFKENGVTGAFYIDPTLAMALTPPEAASVAAD